MNVVHFYGFNFLSLATQFQMVRSSSPPRQGGHEPRAPSRRPRGPVQRAQSALPMCCVHAAPTLEIEHMSTSDIRDPEGEDHVV